MIRPIRLFALYLARILGLFSLAGRLTSGDLRILCYHGAALADEYKFRPGLFITEATFRRRLQILAAGNYPVLSLGEALRHLDEGSLPARATVITIDDGWYGTYSIMGPALREAQLPATLYIATYYLEKCTQVFNVAAGYILWRSAPQTLDLNTVDSGLQGVFDLARGEAREQAVKVLEAWGDTREAADRQRLLEALCQVVGVNWVEIETTRQLQFMTSAEAQRLGAQGVSLQLHTHRHRFPRERSLAEQEISDNRRSLARLSAEPAVHFCYPSGQYSPEQIPWLKELGVRSGVTTKRGLARSSSDRFTLPRLLDFETMTELEFEAEISGFNDLLHRMLP